jgi:hypothetical protein
MVAWLRRHGLAAWVGISLLVSACIALSTPLPHPLPEAALRAEPVYRAEVGWRLFVVLCSAGWVFVGALTSRGLTGDR